MLRQSFSSSLNPPCAELESQALNNRVRGLPRASLLRSPAHRSPELTRIRKADGRGTTVQSTYQDQPSANNDTEKKQMVKV